MTLVITLSTAVNSDKSKSMVNPASFSMVKASSNGPMALVTRASGEKEWLMVSV